MTYWSNLQLDYCRRTRATNSIFAALLLYEYYKKLPSFLSNLVLNFAKMLKIKNVVEIWKCDLCRATPVIDISSNVEEQGPETAFLQHFLSINITENSHPVLVIQRLNFVKTLKFEKVIEIWKCDLCRATPCRTLDIPKIATLLHYRTY